MTFSVPRKWVVVALWVGWYLAGGVSAQGVIFVDRDAPAGGDGGSWASAYQEVREALVDAGSGPAEVWVAEGVYHPSDTDETVSFTLTTGVALYGGFQGTEMSRSQRDPALHPTVLSGDLFENDVTGPGYAWDGYAENSDHVLAAIGAGPTAVLDGFIIESGTGTSVSGGGIFVQGGGPTLRNCTFRYNAAAFSSGGGILCYDSSPLIEGCRFEWNWVHLGKGGGLAIAGTSAPVIRDCTFLHNRVVGASSWAAGAGIYSESSQRITIDRCDFVSNVAENFYTMGGVDGAFGGGVYLLFGGADILSCRFQDNFAHSGAGVFNWVDGTRIVGCLFEGNTVVSYPLSPVAETGGGGAGVGVSGFATRTTTISSCTFVDNQADEGAGAISYGAHELVCDNCIFWGNVSTSPDVFGRRPRSRGAPPSSTRAWKRSTSWSPAKTRSTPRTTPVATISTPCS